MIFLLVYDRSSGKVTNKVKFRDAFVDEANAMRLEAEIQHAHDPNIEVVILQSRSEAELKKTHARYFKTVKELRRAGKTAVTSSTSS